jgi:histidyl-tRNA synthetase
LDRIMLAREASPQVRNAQVYIVSMGDDAQREAFQLASKLRRVGIATEMDLANRSVKGQMKDAARSGARYALILGEAELASGKVTLKDLGSGEQREIEMREVEGAVG